MVPSQSMSREEVLVIFAEVCMYIDAALFVQKVKKGLLHEAAHLVQHHSCAPPGKGTHSRNS